MTLTTPLRDSEAATEAETPLPDGEPPVPALFACEACGAGMRADQDWCLQCGTAAPGRLGVSPGWRAAFTVVGLTLLLLVGAVAASYAALTSDAQRKAAQPSAGAGNPITAQTPGLGQPAAPVTPGATGPGTTAPPATPVQPPPPLVTAPPSQPATNTGSNSGGASDGSSASSQTSGATQGPDPLKLSKDAASLYDPNKRAGAEFGPADNAIDGSAKTVWDVTVPVDGQPLVVGLVVDLGASYALESLTISTPTAGFDIELYAAKGKKPPPNIRDDRWDHLTDRANYVDGKSIALKGRAKGKVRLINLWFVRAADDKDPRVAIGDVKVVATK